MKKMKKSVIAIAAAMVVAGTATTQAQDVTAEQQASVQSVVEKMLPENMVIGQLKVQSLCLRADSVLVDLSENFGDVPFTPQSIKKLQDDIKVAMGAPYYNYKVGLTIDGAGIDNYFSQFDNAVKRKHAPFITNLDPNRHYKKALDGNIIALWPSHGWYFEPKLNRWEWQRARLFQTVEDLYTHSYVLSFLIPMLENAGAYVWDARERDLNNIMAVVDNDGGLSQKGYTEKSGDKKWAQGDSVGFAYARAEYKDYENPFAEGTYRQVEVAKDKKKLATAHWDVDMPEAGDYALYISYKTLPASVNDAHYTVNSLEGTRHYTVDQTMAGGVWVYLCNVNLSKGLNKDVVVLSNMSDNKNGIVTADAVRVGGGKGNIVRRVALPTEENVARAKESGNERCLGKEGVEYKYVGSGEHPYFHIGSRYFLQWSGFPQEVYSASKGINDYTDDYRSRGLWVNYLAGGSDAIPEGKGLNVPVDLSFCLHTDAGTTPNDDIIGTLMIYSTSANGKNFGTYPNGTPRELSRQYADILATEMVRDIRAKYEPKWTRRGMWDKSYYEARVPEVPAVLIELLSHQNYADMKYGLDPCFRFDVSRAMYKGMLKFIAQRDHRDYEVQPLAVNSFAITRIEGQYGGFKLTWRPTTDSLCDKAEAKKYIVCERVGDGAFKEIAVVKDTHYTVKVEDNEVHSYRIIAMNDGGRSFPSETLSLGLARAGKGTVMVVNGFTRVSAPDFIDGDQLAGFLDEKDHGVPYMKQINYLGSQREFRRNLEWRDDDAPGFGACRSNHETEVIAGNTFDYPAVHGKAIMEAGYSFVSSSAMAIENDMSLRNGCYMVDLIMGKQKETPTGRGAKPSRFKMFTPGLIDAITRYTQAGGCVFLSGAYVGTDLWDKKNVNAAETTFAKNVLGYSYVDGSASVTGEVYSVPTINNPGMSDGNKYTFVNKLNDKVYAVESPDAIRASDDKGSTWLRYSENNIPAGIVSNRGNYRTVVMGFPFEVITCEQQRNSLMADVLKWILND